MDLSALFAVGYVGLASGGFGGGVGAQSYGDVNTALVHTLAAERQVSAGPIIFIPIHRPAHFEFKIVVMDDGKGPAGGWQEAKANLPFAETLFPIGLRTWYCPITIGMPIRHSVKGYISPDTAATMSAAVTNRAASNTDFDLPQGIFCDKFRDGVKATFPSMYPGLGERVTL